MAIPGFEDLEQSSDNASIPGFEDIESMENKPKPENILQKAAKSLTFSPQQIGYAVGGGTAPTDIGMSVGSRLMGGPNAQSPAMSAEGNREAQVNKIQNPILRTGSDILTDPQSFADFGMGASAADKAVGSPVGNVLENVGRMASSKKALGFANKLEGMVDTAGSGLSKEMGSSMEAMQAAKPESRISFLNEITRPQLDKKVTQLIKKTDNLHLYDVDNLSLQDSQQIISDLKANLRQGLKTGDVVKSDERGILGFIDELRAKQLEAFPEHQVNLDKYGEGIDSYNDVSGNIPSMMESKGMNRITRAGKEQSLKKISPEASKEYSGFRNTKRAVKATGVATGLGTAYEGAKRFLGGH